MSEEYSDYSEDLWRKTATPEQWRQFMGHDHLNPSRYLAAYLVSEFVFPHEEKVSLAEIGFGDLWDFRWCFKQMHDRGKIGYVGYEIMPHFVRFASDDFWSYDFRQGGFLDLEPNSFDIIYTRHTLEHVHPKLWRDCLVRMLEATKKLCILTWYVPPAPTRLMEENWTGKGWHNQYFKGDVAEIIDNSGLMLEIWEVSSENEVWSIRRDG